MKLHLGCGKRHIPGFVHVDKNDFPHIDHRTEVDRLDFAEDNSVDLVYACHVFEYFDRVQAPAVLAEWRRVLKSSATLRLAVPDFPALIEVYQKYGELQRVLGPLYGRWRIDVDGSTLYHRTVYDFASLQTLLRSCGFTNVRRYRVEDTIHKDYDDYSLAYVPHMDDTGILISLNVEADKEA